MTTTYALSPHERLTVEASTPDLVVRAEYDPGGAPPPLHLHPAQTETFEILAGTITARVGGETREFPAGGAFTVPPRTPHCMWNAGTEPVHARWTTSPAGRTEAWFATVAGLDAAARRSGGRRDVLALATALHAYRDVFRLAAVPAPLAAVAVTVLAGVAGLRDRLGARERGRG